MKDNDNTLGESANNKNQEEVDKVARLEKRLQSALKQNSEQLGAFVKRNNI